MSASAIKTNKLNSHEKEHEIKNETINEIKKGRWSQEQRDKVVMIIQLFLSALAVLIFIKRSFRELISPVGNYQRKYAKKLEKRQFKRKDKLRKLEYKLEKKAVKRNSRSKIEMAE